MFRIIIEGYNLKRLHILVFSRAYNFMFLAVAVSDSSLTPLNSLYPEHYPVSARFYRFPFTANQPAASTHRWGSLFILDIAP